MSEVENKKPIHPNAILARRDDGSVFNWFPHFRGNDSRKSERMRERIQAKMKRQYRGVRFENYGDYNEKRIPLLRKQMTEREKVRIEKAQTYVMGATK